ncbi:MAG: hypothetical protein NT178_10255 [Proteobacteria bacterium]|nr:hypothetical protein [Pseudomonadota bacterium]
MKYFVFGIITVMFILLSDMSVFAQTKGGGWQLYYADESGRYYYDKGSIESPQKGVLKVWQRITETIRAGEEQDNFKIQLQLNCRGKTYEVLSYIEYDGTGEKTLNAQEYKEKRPKISLTLGSRMGVLFENICP